MYKISYFEERNRIYIEISGKLTEIEEKNYITDMMNYLELTSKDFTVCANMKNCHPSVLQRSSNFDVIRNYGSQKGVSQVAIIIDQRVMKAKVGKRFLGANNVFTKIEDAEDYLNN